METRVFYQKGTVGVLLEEGAHDIGSPPSDPWHVLNDDQYRVDGNRFLWWDPYRPESEWDRGESTRVSGTT